MPTVDEELRCVFAGAGVTSLEPDEFTSVMELLFTRETAAGTRITREDALIESERVLLPLLFCGDECAMILRFTGSLGDIQSFALQRGEEGPKCEATIVASLSADNQSKGGIMTGGGRGVGLWHETPARTVTISPCFLLLPLDGLTAAIFTAGQ